MDVDSKLDGEWWLPESRLDPDKIDLEISLGWIGSKLTTFFYFIASMVFGGSLRYVIRVLVSKEDGLEIHYKDYQTGLEEIIYFRSADISSVHRWTSTTSYSDGNEDTSRHNAIMANSLVYNIDIASKKEMGQLCKILELELQTISPNEALEFGMMTEAKYADHRDQIRGLDSKEKPVSVYFYDLGPLPVPIFLGVTSGPVVIFALGFSAWLIAVLVLSIMFATLLVAGYIRNTAAVIQHYERQNTFVIYEGKRPVLVYPRKDTHKLLLEGNSITIFDENGEQIHKTKNDCFDGRGSRKKLVKLLDLELSED